MKLYQDASKTPRERALDLLSRMTTEEKIAQINIIRGVEYAHEGRKSGTCTVEENDIDSSVVTPLKLLRGFERITLKAGESREVCMTLDFDDFKLLGLDWVWRVEPGDFDIMIGASSSDIRLHQIISIPPCGKAAT